MNYVTVGVVLLILLGAVVYFFVGRNQFALPQGDTVSLTNDTNVISQGASGADTTSNRQVSVTDGVKHSIPLDEILSGGPGKDGIPSIDNPKFVSAGSADFLNDTDPGIGLIVDNESRFYPYRILVWHEIVNDTVQGKPVLVTYCPLCATGIVFDRHVGDEVPEFGVSGRLWQSNLLMYNRAGSEDDESLWSQVLGEAVVGVHTGKKLAVVPSDIVRWGDWKQLHPDTKVLTTDTGALRDYGRDPYGDYYTSESVSFGANFRDTRLHPKALVHGIEIDGLYKAYAADALKRDGAFDDTFAGKKIHVTRTEAGEVRFEADGAPLSSIPGFWFSWLAVHPKTELYQ